MVDEARLVKEFMDMVQIDSPSWQEAEMANFLEERLTALGCQVTRDDAGTKIKGSTGNLIVRLEPKGKPEQYIFFSAHMDTVKPGVGIVPVLEEGIIRSAGDTILGGDDKAGLAAILEMVRQVIEQDIEHGGIELLITICEEQGLLGATNLDISNVKAKTGYILDASGDVGTIIVKGPGQNRIDVEIQGKAAHAGMCPEEGISALQVAAKAIAEMHLGRIDEETTANMGMIHGGTATNIVPDLVKLKGEARSINPEKLERQTRHMAELFQAKAAEAGARAEVRVEKLYSQIDISPDSLGVKAVLAACQQLGVEPRLGSTGGGSDANVFCEKGLVAVNLGIGMQDVHTNNESISVKDLVASARLLIEIVKQINQTPTPQK